MNLRRAGSVDQIWANSESRRERSVRARRTKCVYAARASRGRHGKCRYQGAEDDRLRSAAAASTSPIAIHTKKSARQIIRRATACTRARSCTVTRRVKATHTPPRRPAALRRLAGRPEVLGPTHCEEGTWSAALVSGGRAAARMEESECTPPPCATRVGVPHPSWVRVWHVGPTGGERGEGARVYADAPVPRP